LASLIGIPYFFSDDGVDYLKSMESSLRSAKRKDLRILKDATQQCSEGGQPIAVKSSHFQKAAHDAITHIRKQFGGQVIRRTLFSTDSSGQPISGLKPIKEVYLNLDLSDKENEGLKELTSKIIETRGRSERAV
jgi:hypothetical protein